MVVITTDVAKDLNAIKPKFVGFFTKRQFFCFSAAAICGVPLYFFTKGPLGTNIAALLMVAVMLPFFFVAMYEKDGMPAERIAYLWFQMKIMRSGIRKYRSESIYEKIRREEDLKKEVEFLERKRKSFKEKPKSG